MKPGLQLLQTEAAAIGSLIVVAFLLGVAGALHTHYSPGMFSPAGAAGIYYFGTLMFGILPVVLYGAPAYAWLARTGRANWITVTIVALVPAPLLLPFDFHLAATTLVCAPPVAWLTHLACRKWVHPDGTP